MARGKQERKQLLDWHDAQLQNLGRQIKNTKKNCAQVHISLFHSTEIGRRRLKLWQFQNAGSGLRLDDLKSCF